MSVSYLDRAKDLWGLTDEVYPNELATTPAETTQQAATRIVQDAMRPGQAPTQLAEQPQLRDTQAVSLPNPSSRLRLKQKLRDMVAREG